MEFPRPLRAYKFLAPEHAEGALSGQFKICPVSEYARLENDQRDEFDSSVIRILNKPAIIRDNDDPDRAEKIAALARVGCDVGGNIRNSGVLSATKVTTVDALALCFSLSPDPSAFPAGSACIEIADLDALATVLIDANRDRVSFHALVGPVSYEEITHSAYDVDEHAADPFIKDPRFKKEAEARIVWDRMDRCGCFISKPTKVPLGLLRRLF